MSIEQSPNDELIPYITEDNEVTWIYTSDYYQLLNEVIPKQESPE